MTPDEARTLTFPATCWHEECDDDGLWMPTEVTVLSVGLQPGASLASLVCRGSHKDVSKRYVTSLENVYLTRKEVEEVISEGLLGSYQSCVETIADANAETAKLRQHPLWKELP